MLPMLTGVKRLSVSPPAPSYLTWAAQASGPSLPVTTTGRCQPISRCQLRGQNKHQPREEKAVSGVFIIEIVRIIGTMNGLEDLAGLAADLARLEMDRDSCDIVFVVRDTMRESG